MSSDLTKYIENLPIHTFLLTGDLLVIGRIVESQIGAVQLSAACSVETHSDENSFQQILYPLVAYSLEQITTIYRQHIILQTPAGFALKKCYCDTLLRIKLMEQQGFTASTSIPLETNDQILNSNSFKNRWMP